MSTSNYWALLANPGKYRIEDAVKELTEDYWTVGSSKLQVGDMCLIWKAKGASSKRGVIAFAEVLTEPEIVEESEESFEYWVEKFDPSAEMRVRVKYVPLATPLWVEEDTSDTLKNLSVAKARGGTVFRVLPEQWMAIWSLALIGKYQSPILLKEVGKSQFKDGVRINKEFHKIFNPQTNPDYVPRGAARKVTVSFNNKLFKANYRFEGTLASDADLQRIGFNRELCDEFVKVFPQRKGFFSIKMGKDINHFDFIVEAVSSTKESVSEKPSRKPWTERECYFAVWCYDQMDQYDDVVKTELYSQIAAITVRSEKSIEWKVQNVSACDPRLRENKPISEAPNAQKLLKEVFEWYWADKQAARNKYDTYFQEAQLNTPSNKVHFTPPKQVIIEEGAPGYQQSRIRKRSVALLNAARKYYSNQEHDKRLRCKACGFTKPDSVVREIIQIHHIMPISDSGEGHSIELDEALQLVIPLCPTCHQIAHSTSPPICAENIKVLL